MDLVKLGPTGLHVSALCFGTMSFGGDADAAEAARMYRACRDAGVTFFDCANVYNGGRAEEILGDLVAGERDSLILTSKCGHAAGPGPNERGLSSRHIRLSVEGSLRRLRTDRLEILFLHQWDPLSPLEETLRTLEDLVRAGKVLHLGASNFAAWQVARGLGLSALHGWSGFQILQPMYNLVKRQAEVEILPLAMAEGLAVTPYNPVGGGLLSGKYLEPGADGRLAAHAGYARRYGDPWMSEAAARFVGLAREIGAHPVTLAVAWAASHPAVTAPIIGARNTGQLAASLAAADFAMTPELRARIAALSPTPPPATDRTDDP